MARSNVEKPKLSVSAPVFFPRFCFIRRTHTTTRPTTAHRLPFVSVVVKSIFPICIRRPSVCVCLCLCARAYVDVAPVAVALHFYYCCSFDRTLMRSEMQNKCTFGVFHSSEYSSRTICGCHKTTTGLPSCAMVSFFAIFGVFLCMTNKSSARQRLVERAHARHSRRLDYTVLYCVAIVIVS